MGAETSDREPSTHAPPMAHRPRSGAGELEPGRSSLSLDMSGWANRMRLISTEDVMSLYVEKQSDWWSNIQGGPQITRTYLACNWTIIMLGGTAPLC